MKKKESKTVREAEVIVDRCTLSRPLMIVIPDEGLVIKCPEHGEHRVYGPRVKF